MAEVEGLPQDAGEIPEEIAELEETGGSPGPKGLLGKLWYYHPLVFLAVSLVLAAVAFAVRPRPEAVKPRSAEELYRDGLSALRAAMEVDRPLGPGGVEDAVRNAYADFKLMFQYWRRDLSRHPEFVNPYLLLGEAARRYAQLASHTPSKRKRLLEEALFAYEQGLAWERRKWKDPRIYIAANFGREGRLPIASELQVRRRRRDRFLRYQRAAVLLELGRHDLALRRLQQLAREFRREQIPGPGAAPADGARIPGAGPGGALFLPRRFELLAEDRAKIHYYLARAHAALQQIEAAAREYNRFLLDAPRSRERFLALVWLAGDYTARARRLMKASAQAGGEATRREVMHLLRMAADKYEQVVRASAPEKILREAYFRGGRVFLAMADNIVVGRKTWWDLFTDIGRDAAAALREFAGRELPERTRWLPVFLGVQAEEGAAATPSPLDVWTWGPAGSLLRMAASPRRTRREQREEYLTRAEEFFDGARGGERGEYDAASRVMIANVLLARGEREKARRLFLHTMRNHPAAEVQIACQWGVARSFLAEGKLDRARVRLIGGVENEKDNLLQEGDVSGPSWVEMCRTLARAAKSGKKQVGESNAPAVDREAKALRAACLRIWEHLPADVRSLASSVEHAGRIDRERAARLLVAVNELLRRRDLCPADGLQGLRLPDLAWDLRARDRQAMLQPEIEWLNRMYLEAVFPRVFPRTGGGKRFAPLPPLADLPQGMLINAEELEADLHRLAHAYLRRADEQEAYLSGLRGTHTATASTRNNPTVHRARVLLRRALEDAAAVNDFLLAGYAPGDIGVLLENGEIFRRLAAVVAAAPFRRTALARDYVARSARTYYRVARLAPGTPREEAALWQAGWAFFRARQFGRAKETLSRYVERYRASDRAGMAQNLLGRSCFNLGELEEAARVYLDNTSRRSPAGNKAFCYLGWTYLEMGSSRGPDGKMHDRIGDPARPLAERAGRLARVETALQAFNEVRGLPGVKPESRAWRWATFGLGRTWYRIAMRAKRTAQGTQAGGKSSRPGPWVGWLRDRALAYLREAYERYLLKNASGEGPGLDPWTEPEDYGEVTCARFVTEYRMAMAQLELAGTLGESERAARAREHLEHLVDERLYPDVMFDASARPRLYLLIAARQRSRQGGTGEAAGGGDTREPLLGVVEGPEYQPGYLRGLRRNAFFLLGQSYVEEGERLQTQYPRRALGAFRRAYAVYQAAHDRLSPADTPQVIYLQGVCLQRMGLTAEAARKFALAVNTARNLKDMRADSLGESRPAYWASLAADRLRSLEEKRQ